MHLKPLQNVANSELKIHRTLHRLKSNLIRSINRSNCTFASPTMHSTVLSERDANIKQPVAASDNKPKSMEYHRQVLESRLKEGKLVASSHHSSADAQPAAAIEPLSSSAPAKCLTKNLQSRNQQTYVSPSDTIQSPATQKLAAFKNKHIKRYGITGF